MKYITRFLPLLFVIYASVNINHTFANNSVYPNLIVPAQCAPYVPLIEKYDWNVQTAINVMYQESTCNSEIVNLSDKHFGKIYPRDYPLGYCLGSFSLFQTSCNDFISYDPTLEIAVAYQVYKEQGWLGGWKTTCTTKIKCSK